MSAQREIVFINEAREQAKILWNAYHALIQMQDEWNALDYSNALDAGTGDNTGITKTEIGAVVFDTMNEVKARIFDTGHKTNLAKLL
jgi:hypothetical protein